MKTTSIAILGQVLLWIGFLGGALAAVYRLENTSAPWQTIPWWMYATCAAIGVFGVVLLRRDKAAQRLLSGTSEAGLGSTAEKLQQVAEKVAAFASEIQEKECEQVLAFIDDQCAALLAEFADGRLVISNRFGATTYAAVMTEFASGERYLNRAWSAAADGYVDEVVASIHHASNFLSAAHHKLHQARQTQA